MPGKKAMCLRKQTISTLIGSYVDGCRPESGPNPKRANSNERRSNVNRKILLLGIDGGGTSCRARLCAFSGQLLGEATTGPANLRLGLQQSFSAVLGAAAQCLSQAGLPHSDVEKIVACLALAGASEPTYLAAAQAFPLPFRRAIVTTDAHAACLGAHGERDGGVIVAGTGAVGWATIGGQTHRIGGWGMPISDEGSGAWLGFEAVRRLLWAFDGRLAWSGLLHTLGERFGHDPHGVVTWAQSASPGDFGSLAPDVFAHALRGDPIGRQLVGLAATHIDALAARLIEIGAIRLALVGGCAPFLAPSLSERTKSHLVEPAGDALAGALHLASSLAQTLAQVA
jgi:glucosamine kinase